jgi:hypothetical protein
VTGQRLFDWFYPIVILAIVYSACGQSLYAIERFVPISRSIFVFENSFSGEVGVDSVEVSSIGFTKFLLGSNCKHSRQALREYGSNDVGEIEMRYGRSGRSLTLLISDTLKKASYILSLLSPQVESAILYLQGWRSSIVLIVDIPENRLVFFDNWVLRTNPNIRSALQREIAIAVLPLVVVDVAIPQQTEEAENLYRKRRPFKELAAIAAGFLFVGWGWWRIRFEWYGIKTFILGLCSFTVGVILWMYGISHFLEWSKKF